MRPIWVVLAVALHGSALTTVLAAQEGQLFRVASKDGTQIAVECAGAGPTLVIAHGGIGDRTRWTPMFRFLSSRFTVCAMDRRGHGASGDSPDYSLQKEATFLTARISKLLLYEPPLQDRVDLAVVNRIERLIKEGSREQAVVTFLREVVMVPRKEVDSMRSRAGWRHLVHGIDAHPRQMRALAAYRLDPKRMRTVVMPTLLIKGSETRIPDVLRALRRLRATLPNRSVVVLRGQQHNAMDTGRELLADAITNFLVGTADTVRSPRGAGETE